MNPISQFSYVFLAALVLLAFGGYFWYQGFDRRKGFTLGLLAVGFVGAWVALRPGTSPVQETAQAQLIIREAQQPVLIEFYSDYCAGCIAAKPALDQLERELADQLKIVRLDVASAAGRDLGRQLNVNVTPTFILFDAEGNELWRMLGGLDPSEVVRVLGEG